MAEDESTRETLLGTLKQKMKDFVKDTVTLDVLTLTGRIELVKPEDTTTANKKDIFNWDNIFKNVADELKTGKSAAVSIVAYTHAEWDQDSVNYVDQNADVKLVEAHGKTVAAAHEARMNSVKSSVEAIEKLFK